MIFCICSFTPQGKITEDRIKSLLGEHVFISFDKTMTLEEWIKKAFDVHIGMIFTGAAGIAVRLIAPYVKDKLIDSPVIVIDEEARFVIPLLSGHMGGANEISLMLSQRLGAQCVLTTATDVEDLFSVDVFARHNQLRIINRQAVKYVSSRLLDGKTVSISFEKGIKTNGENRNKNIMVVPYGEKADVYVKKEICTEDAGDKSLYLVPKKICLGVGCRKDVSFESLKDFVLENLNGYSLEDIAAICSINLKEKEKGLLILSRYLNADFRTYSAEELNRAEGCFKASDFVKKTTGTDNVCERAAALCAGKGYEMIIEKKSCDGMTLAAAIKTDFIMRLE